mmetsp:Transcript_41377/g.58230  ORF Transcript_41377/g.58230 Transcript_41377/m.58230 type:complete len:166 (-) Transcript_41377:71-568(-)|eukprot:CAMPEP_0202457174 /NCGR_PEP_ID=MMETSP1360-20130828/14250_1 /ASSEMBLY_ACC=CAM_ASM_000848 /TAXON_ID=515479 /ORGANISM="Licmophora paradoxa, Strain CCMP2313" /LENGTH=165 /DNA_ID=CAMNT_0049077181 /DNA_START=31 /DNA_END=528 /DNA_ORIENTATION=-
MLSRTAATLARRSGVAARAAASFSTEAASMKLNFALPQETIYNGAEVQQVIIPGTDGEYGITANHVPTVSQLKPGVVQILHSAGEPEKYFVAGGFAFTHANSLTEISCPEAVKLDDIDTDAVSKVFEAAKSAYAAAETGSVAQAEAQIEMETAKAMGMAVGVMLA